MLDSGERYALLLSTLAGLSTSIGGCIAVSASANIAPDAEQVVVVLTPDTGRLQRPTAPAVAWPIAYCICCLVSATPAAS